MATGSIKKTTFMDVTYSKGYTCAANSFTSFSDSELGISTPSGYELAGIIAAWTGNGECVLRNIGVGNNCSVKNTTSSSQSGTFGIRLRYMRVG